MGLFPVTSRRCWSLFTTTTPSSLATASRGLRTLLPLPLPLLLPALLLPALLLLSFATIPCNSSGCVAGFSLSQSALVVVSISLRGEKPLSKYSAAVIALTATTRPAPAPEYGDRFDNWK